MNWNISAWCIRHPVPPIVLFLALTVMGLFSFVQLGIDENPNIDVPIVSVSVAQTGAAPTELETEVTRKVEDAVAGIGNIKHISSTVNEGYSLTSIEFELGTNTDRATNDVRDAVTRIRQDLPQGIDEPIISRVDFVGGPFASYTVSSDRMNVSELSWLVDNEISRSLLSVKGVGQVQRAGGVDREIRINLDPYKLEALGITADTVNAQVRSLNINLPGGRGQIGSSEQSIRTLGSAPTVEQLRATEIALPSGRWARLDTLGTVTDGTSDQRQLALLEGKPVVAFSVVRSTGSNLVDVDKGVEAKLAELKKAMPGVSFTKVWTTSKYILESYHASFESLILGAVLAVLVVWAYLRDWRAALISALAMPLSMIPTFAVMKWAGFTLNGMSLLGLALVIGILVDDAIVEIENIVRHINMGKKPYDAALEAADEIGLAVIATTATILVVYIPVAFMGGIPGQFFKQFGLTVAVSVFFSLLVARMVTPLIAAFFLTPQKVHSESSPAMRLYERSLRWSLSHRLLTVAAATAFFLASIGLFKTMPTSLISKVDRGVTILNVELPPGSDVQDSLKAAEELTRIVMRRPEVKSVYASVGAPVIRMGRGGGGGGEVNKASLYITLKPKGERKLSQQEFERSLRPELNSVPGVRLSFMGLMGLSGNLRILLTSDDAVALKKTSEAVTDQMRALHGFSDVKSSASLLRPEILVRPDFARAAEQGVSVQSIARTALIATLGDVDANLAKFNLPDRQINIRVQLDPAYRKDIDVIGNLRVAAANGRLVPLSTVAVEEVGSGPSQIDRYDRARQVSIDATLDSSVPLGTALKQVHGLPAFTGMPKSIRELPSGDAEIQKDVFSGFGAAIGYAVLLIYLVLVLLFHGFLQPATIMMSLPLSLGGALIGLVALHESLGMYALIGIVMLMGLVTKNAILLVEYCLKAMNAGVPRETAIWTGGRTRMRPILMTTVAMIAGMLPIALGLGAGAEVRAPMAIAVVGGLVTSTLLTLVVVPVVFTYVDDFQGWLVRKVTGRPAPPAGQDDRVVASSSGITRL